MKPQQDFSRQGQDQSGIDWRMLGRLGIVLAICVPVVAMAAPGDDAQTTICGLMTTLHSILTAISVGVVTIAIIFAGYQIAFAHKRIAEVAPILIGGVLIGAAGQIASTLISKTLSGAETDCTKATSITPDVILNQFASIAHSLAGYLA
jgi:type IV secretion system protein VirB2